MILTRGLLVVEVQLITANLDEKTNALHFIRESYLFRRKQLVHALHHLDIGWYGH